MTHTEFQLDRPLALRTLAGDVLALHAQRIDVGARGVVLAGTLPWEAWKRVTEQGWLNTDERELPPAFESGEPVAVRLALRPGLAGLLFGDIDVVTTLFESPEDAGLLLSESWRLLDATQRVELPELPDATTSVGVQTRWAVAPVPSRSLAEVVEQGMVDRGWTPERLHEDMFRVRLGQQQREWVLIVRVDAAQALCVVYSLFPDAVPEGRRARAGLALAGLNRELDLCAAELDLGDGELTLRIGVDVSGAELHPAVFRHLLDRNIEAFTDAYDLFADLAKGDS